MRTGKRGRELIKHFEGCRLKPYKDIAALWTIGWGHRIGLREVKEYSKGITQELADQWLDGDLLRFEVLIRSIIKVPLSQNQLDALVSLAYNIGPQSFRHSTLVKKLNSGGYKEASDEFGRWIYAKVVGRMREVQGLVRRRKAERDLFLLS